MNESQTEVALRYLDSIRPTRERREEEVMKSTFITYQNRARKWLRWMEDNGYGDVPFADVKRHHLVEYKEWLEAKGERSKSIRACWNPLAMMWDWAEASNVVPEYHNPARRVKLPEVEEDTLRYKPSDDEVWALFTMVERIPDLWARALSRAVLALVSHGLLRSGCEAAPLLLRNYRRNGDIGVLKVAKGKFGKTRTTFVGPEVADAIDKWLVVRPTDQKSNRLLLTQRNKGLGDEHLRDLLRDLCVMADVTTDLTPHCLRHWGATYLLRQGVDIKTISKMLGHANIQTTYNYLYTGEEEMKKAARTQRIRRHDEADDDEDFGPGKALVLPPSPKAPVPARKSCSTPSTIWIA